MHQLEPRVGVTHFAKRPDPRPHSELLSLTIGKMKQANTEIAGVVRQRYQQAASFAEYGFRFDYGTLNQALFTGPYPAKRNHPGAVLERPGQVKQQIERGDDAQPIQLFRQGWTYAS